MTIVGIIVLFFLACFARSLTKPLLQILCVLVVVGFSVGYFNQESFWFTIGILALYAAIPVGIVFVVGSLIRDIFVWASQEVNGVLKEGDR